MNTKLKDPAFLFYDADAARDVAYLNRLERGCYFDLILAQKKFGSMNLQLIKRILGNDFELCWKNLEIGLCCDDENYYIPWLEESIIKRKAYCASRGRNRLGSRKKNPVTAVSPAAGHQPALSHVNRTAPTVAVRQFSMDDLKKYFAAAPQKKEQIAMLYKLTPENLEHLIAIFCLKENEYANSKEALGHFLYWLDRQNKLKYDKQKTLVEQWME